MANLNAIKSKRLSGDTGAAMAAVAKPFAEAFASCGEICTKGFVEWQQEMSRFAHDRLTQNGQTVDALAQCHDVSELFGLQQEWLKQASQDYLQESARVFGLANRLTQAWMQPMVRLWGDGLAAQVKASSAMAAE